MSSTSGVRSAVAPGLVRSASYGASALQTRPASAMSWIPHIKPGCLAPTPNQTDLWCPGDPGTDETYECYKIPSLLRIPNSSHLLAFIEARRFSCSDAGWIDVLVKCSLDGGKSWSKAALVVSDPNLRSNTSEWHTIGDALPVFDALTRRLHLIFTRDNEDAFVTHSDNLGASWSRPRNISSAAIPRRGPFWGLATLRVAAFVWRFQGRLLVPMYCQGNAVTQEGGGAYALVSDDHGQTWRRGGTIGNASGNEWVAAVAATPVSSGRLLGSLRSESASRLQAYSDDGGESWSEPTHMHSLPEPISGCEGAMVGHPNGKLYYSHPDSHVLRQIMNIKRSDDHGKTWVQHAQIWGPNAGCAPPCVAAASYSSLAVLGEDAESEIAIFYMRNNATMLIFEGRGVSFTKFAP